MFILNIMRDRFTWFNGFTWKIERVTPCPLNLNIMMPMVAERLYELCDISRFLARRLARFSVLSKGKMALSSIYG